MAPRTKDENNTVDWEKVLSNSLEGITEDFGPLGDALIYNQADGMIIIFTI